MSRFLSAKHAGMKPYVPGEQPQDMQYIKLNTNESPFPPAPAVAKAAEAEAVRCNLYSDPVCRIVRERLAERYEVGLNNVLLTNGSDEALNFIILAYGDERHPFAFCDVTYGLYPVLCRLYHIPYTELPLRPDYSVDVEACTWSDDPLILANPNAPTSLALRRDTLEMIIASRSDRLVVVDEAYIDFGGESCVPLVKKYDNLLVVQTFSKSRSLAGARLGYIIGCEEMIAELDAIRCSLNPYNVNRMSLAAGAAALDEDQWYMENCRVIMENRQWTARQLRDMGFSMPESSANFLFVSHPALSGEALYKALKARGILVRYFSAPRTASHVRVTVGTMEQMQAFIDETRKILKEVQP
ncbi:MAG: histidinol-phosphate transaminase [Clostridia bacterium]|nr:histidinol-phosphate transaminase [Clostridia bacterium]